MPSTRAFRTSRSAWAAWKIFEERWLGNISRFWPVIDLHRKPMIRHSITDDPWLNCCRADGTFPHWWRISSARGSRPRAARRLQARQLSDPPNTQWLSRQIPEHGPGNGICHYQRWRSKEICADTGVNSRLEIAIAGSTAAHTRSFVAIASSIGSDSGPELPIQVVQP